MIIIRCKTCAHLHAEGMCSVGGLTVDARAARNTEAAIEKGLRRVPDEHFVLLEVAGLVLMKPTDVTSNGAGLLMQAWTQDWAAQIADMNHVAREVRLAVLHTLADSNHELAIARAKGIEAYVASYVLLAARNAAAQHDETEVVGG